MSKETVFEKLWSSMAARGDVPSLQYSVDNIVASLHREQASAAELSSLVLSDLALSQKVIRLANSAMYATLGGEVTTVSRAIMVLGVDTVEHLCLGLQLLSQFKSACGTHAAAAVALKRALLAADFARAATANRGARESEEVVVCTLMHHLSRLLIILYFEKEWSDVVALCESNPNLSESDACMSVLGVSLEEVAVRASEKWGLPGSLAKSMCARLPAPGAVPPTHDEWKAAVAGLAAGVALRMDQGESTDAIAGFVRQHAEQLAISKENVAVALHKTQQAHARIDVTTEATAEGPKLPAAADASPAKRLRKGLTAIREEAASLNAQAIIPWVVESVTQGMALKNSFLMLLNPQTKQFVGRFAVGEEARPQLGKLNFDAGFVPDVFHEAASNGAPVLIDNLRGPDVAHRVPDWYQQAFPRAASLLLVPVRLSNRCVGLLCGDWGSEQYSAGLSSMEAAELASLAGEISRSFIRSASRGAGQA